MKIILNILLILCLNSNLYSQLENIEVKKGSKITYFKNPGDIHHQYDQLNEKYSSVLNHIFNSNGNHFSVDILNSSTNKRYSIISESKAKDFRFMGLQFINNKYYLYSIETTDDKNNLYYQILDEESDFKVVGKPTLIYSTDRLDKVWERYGQSMYFYTNKLNEVGKYENKFSKINLSPDKSKILHFTEFASSASKTLTRPVAVYIADNNYEKIWNEVLELPNTVNKIFKIKYNITNQADVIFTYFSTKENSKGKYSDYPVFNVAKYSKDNKEPVSFTFELDNYIPKDMETKIVGNNLLISGIAKNRDKSIKELSIFYYKINLKDLSIENEIVQTIKKNIITDKETKEDISVKFWDFNIRDIVVNSKNEAFLIFEEIQDLTDSYRIKYLFGDLYVSSLQFDDFKTFLLDKGTIKDQLKGISSDHSGIQYFFHNDKLQIQFLESKTNLSSTGENIFKRTDSKDVMTYFESVLVNAFGFESGNINYQILYTNEKTKSIKPLKFIMKNENEIILDFFDNITLKYE